MSEELLYEEEMSKKYPPRDENYCFECENPPHLCICSEVLCGCEV